MTEEIEALLGLAERHASSVAILRRCLSPLKSAEAYMTELQWQMYARLRHIIEAHDQALRERAMQLRRPPPP